ncbi:phage protein NinX family protein [Cupriavidus basilensis]|uniref:phage protein NinX family protein n=1 Tax=Cupriavidus basilensis TaxID=68895 RepID=UPI0020A679B9|nr:phage protein NinX family protein [Cupriavidus basilensis]MCP3017519.1 DUF2591 domain-containing protein [Cupriavidus basilensis]
MKVTDLEGALLNYWVARAEGLRCEIRPRKGVAHAYIFIDTAVHADYPRIYRPSEDWSDGGPILDLRMQVCGVLNRDNHAPESSRYRCAMGNYPHARMYQGHTILVAAMRAYVASKFGHEVPEVSL